MLLVLLVTATAAVLSWAMLYSASMRACVDSNSADLSNVQSLAEAGMSVAMHYLKNPTYSPVALTNGSYGDVYYAGQSNLSLWSGCPGTVSIQVTNTGAGKFHVIATATVVGRSSSSIVRTIEADVAKQFTGNYTIGDALQLNGGSGSPSNVTVKGPVTALLTTVVLGVTVVTGTVTGTVDGVLNLLSLGSSSNTAAPVADRTRILLVQETGVVAPNGTSSAQRTYTWQGKQYIADVLPVTVTADLKPTSTNPAGVYYAERSVTLNNIQVQGTIVVRTANTLTIRGTVSFNPKNEMPAIITDTLDLQSSTSNNLNLDIQGLVWVGKTVTNSLSTTTQGAARIKGALLIAGTSPFGTSLKFPIELDYQESKVRVPTFLGADVYNGVQVLSWSEH